MTNIKYKISEPNFFGFFLGLGYKRLITNSLDGTKLYFGQKKFNLFNNPYDEVFIDEKRSVFFLKVESIYPNLKFRNKAIEPDCYKILDGNGKLIGFLENGKKIVNNYWKILDVDKQELAKLEKVVSFRGMLYDLKSFFGLISFGILEFLFYFFNSLLFNRLLVVKYVIKINSKVIMEMEKTVSYLSAQMNLKLLDENPHLSKELVLASAMRAFPGGSHFYPNNGVGDSSAD